MSDQQITLIGNLTVDPIIRYNTNGKPSCSSSLAVNRRYQANGEWQEDTQFFTIVLFGPIAENAAASLKKGNRVIVTGRLENREFVDKQGVNRRQTELIVDDIGASLKFATATIDRVQRDQLRIVKPAVEVDEEPF